MSPEYTVHEWHADDIIWIHRPALTVLLLIMMSDLPLLHKISNYNKMYQNKEHLDLFTSA